MIFAIIASGLIAGASAYVIGNLSGYRDGARRVFDDLKTTGTCKLLGQTAFGCAMSDADYGTAPTDELMACFPKPQAEVIRRDPVTVTVKTDPAEARQIVRNLSHEAEVLVRGSHPFLEPVSQA